jgi:PD-(D/E)XK nuclease superfamily protein
VTAVGLDISQYLDAEPVVRERWLLPIEHLSASSLGMLARCPEQFRQRYVLGKKERPGEALVIGTAVHKTAEENFRQKIESHEDLPASWLIQWYDDVGFPLALEERQEKGEEVAWDTDPEGARKRGRAITTAYHTSYESADGHHPSPASRVQPLTVETRVEADFGLPVPIIGYADVETEQTVIDIKTSKTARRQIKPEWRIQGAVYSTITLKPIDFHCVSASEKQFRATVFTPLEAPDLSLWLPPEARAETQRNVRAMAWMAHHFMETLGPDDPWPTTGQVHPWACSWCAFKPDCPAWKGLT